VSNESTRQSTAGRLSRDEDEIEGKAFSAAGAAELGGGGTADSSEERSSKREAKKEEGVIRRQKRRGDRGARGAAGSTEPSSEKARSRQRTNWQPDYSYNLSVAVKTAPASTNKHLISALMFLFISHLILCPSRTLSCLPSRPRRPRRSRSGQQQDLLPFLCPNSHLQLYLES
jgi:hypothetical protein